ncbi:MAG: GTP cyclohydrolase I FolE [Methanobacteriota archaeon]
MTPNGSNGRSKRRAAPSLDVLRNGDGNGTLAQRTDDVAEEAVRAILRATGEDPEREGLRETPRRVIRAFRELTEGYSEDPAEILSRDFVDAYDEIVIVEGIEFWSLCEHHLLPFHGKATVAYLPNGRVVGLSKLARLVHGFARRLQVQERLTDQIADAIEEHLGTRGVAVHVEAQHMCMSMRGVQVPATTVTRAFRGALRDGERRREFLDLVRSRGVFP